MAVIAIDLGASSGRAIAYSLLNDKLDSIELHRFTNEPVMVNGHFRWDVLRLFAEIKTALKLAVKQNIHIDSISIDSWGVDYCLFDNDGQLLSNPHHYRDSRTHGIVDNYSQITKREIFNISGTALSEINTFYQLACEKASLIELTDKILYIPNALEFMLSGTYSADASIASTTGFYTIRGYDKRAIECLGISSDKFAPIIKPDSIQGFLQKSVLNEIGADYEIPIVQGLGHDTACAVFSVPSQQNDSLYISSGTWSLFGTLLNEPIIDDATFNSGFTNEIGYDKIRYLKGISGMWIFEEVLRSLKAEGYNYTYAQLDNMADNSTPFYALIDMASSDFVAPYNMPDRIRNYVKRTQNITALTIPQMLRCIYESLALEYYLAYCDITALTHKKYNEIYIIGGGCKNKMLCNFTANLTGATVYAGPVEATSMGNALCQLIATKKISNANQAKKLVKASTDVKLYTPNNKTDFSAIIERYKKLKMLKV